MHFLLYSKNVDHVKGIAFLLWPVALNEWYMSTKHKYLQYS